MGSSYLEKPFRLHDVAAAFIGIALVLSAGWSLTISSWALTPAQALQAGEPPLPAGWEAGYWSHGEWVQWYSLEQHPLIFIALICSLLLGVALVWWKLFRSFMTTGTPEQEYIKKLFK
jgi:hypothetical protein